MNLFVVSVSWANKLIFFQEMLFFLSVRWVSTYDRWRPEKEFFSSIWVIGNFLSGSIFDNSKLWQLTFFRLTGLREITLTWRLLNYWTFALIIGQETPKCASEQFKAWPRSIVNDNSQHFWAGINYRRAIHHNEQLNATDQLHVWINVLALSHYLSLPLRIYLCHNYACVYACLSLSSSRCDSHIRFSRACQL